MVQSITLYRPVGAEELKLIVDSGMKSFPTRLSWQPIFYPVLNFKYASEIAERWNMGNIDSGGAGFVTAFEIPEEYFMTFAVQTVGLDYHQELWVPADQLNEFNSMIIGLIRIDHAYIGKKFNIPEEIAHVLPFKFVRYYPDPILIAVVS